LKLLLDEDSEARVLAQRLTQAGHDVLTVGDLEQRGAPDEVVLQLAQTTNRVLLTRNCADFKRLHQSAPGHTGIVAVYQERDPRKDMSYKEITQALGVVEQAGAMVSGVFVCLNEWRGKTV
jgi:hypothetical protein